MPMDAFEKSGPSHLKVVDWGNENHCRIVMASLVEGVYVLEQTRRHSGTEAKVSDSQWWKFFNFELVRSIEDDNSDIFAAIYKFNPPIISCSSREYVNLPSISCSSPEYVVAFRGTANSQDIRKDWKVVRNNFHLDDRCLIGVEEVDNLVHANKGSNIWIAGHSLGSSVGLYVGKAMAVKGIRLETFLFNPPHPSISVPVEWIPSERVKRLFHLGRSLTKAGLAMVLRSKSQREHTREQFLKAHEWLPSLFVHGSDVICSSYIGYFKDRDLMKKLKLERVELLATQHTRRCLVFHDAGQDFEPFHLIPSARLIINRTRLNPYEAHKLERWWSSEMPLDSKEHILDDSVVIIM